MRSWQIEKTGGLECLRVVERERPAPGPRQVLVRVRAVSLNFRDLIVLGGMLGPLSHPNLIPGSDGAGEVVAVGAGTSRFKPGDRVIGIFRQRWLSGRFSAMDSSSDLGGSGDGMLSEYVVLSEEGLVGIPEPLSFEEAACLPCAAVTAWNAIVSRGATRLGETVLVQGTGGVALFALQFAKAAGARVIATTSSDAKAERLLALGAAAVVNYKTHEEWHSEILRLTEGRGADLVVETGGPGTWSKSIQATAIGGRVILVGLLTGLDESKSGPVFLPVFLRETTVTSVHVGSREMFEDMNRSIAAHAIRPVIDSVFPFEQAHQAYRRLQSGEHFGKIVIALR